MITLPYLEADTPFPSVNEALDDPDGLLAYGADLSPGRLLTAYSNGIFPWFSEGEPILWWSPSVRAIIPLEDFICSTSLAKLIRKQRYTVTLNQNFHAVINTCATIPRQQRRRNGSVTTSTATWITQDMINAYLHLHALGLAHSVEVWDNSQLVGGLYGVAIGSVFCGESMFHRQPNTSKLAMAHLVAHMQRHDGSFIDCQLPTDHLMSLGAQAIPRSKFIKKLAARNLTLDSEGYIGQEYAHRWQPQTITL
ncbi:leucyl/phenylalanyl-tRNA--protein transferase [Alteromonas sp. AMM-1]|uniref:leucyl/phenylalanyl-tRNA--protein transferase n=1 Tax=Alteromonas sp. AMM-1 TaxID=3394233 RepID=UPI0039A5D022